MIYPLRTRPVTWPCMHILLLRECVPASETGLAGSRVGLNMNYSIMFTEISFYPETSILLQVITNNSYDNLDYARIRQKRVGSLPILASRQRT